MENTYLQQINARYRRAGVWACIVPLSQVIQGLEANPAVRVHLASESKKHKRGFATTARRYA